MGGMGGLEGATIELGRLNNLRRIIRKTTPGQGNGTEAYRRRLLTGVHIDAIFWGSMPRPTRKD